MELIMFCEKKNAYKNNVQQKNNKFIRKKM